MSGALIAAAVFAALPVRDPFWPVGYEGERHVISASLRFAPDAKSAAETGAATNGVGAAAVRNEGAKELSGPDAAVWASLAAADEARKAKEMSVRWDEARRTLRFGAYVQMKSDDGAVTNSVMLVNGAACMAGDVVSVDYDGCRFAWRVESCEDERKLRLTRLKATRLESSKGKKKQ